MKHLVENRHIQLDQDFFIKIWKPVNINFSRKIEKIPL